MNWPAIIVIALFALALLLVIILFLSRKIFKTAIASLIGILAGMSASLAAPTAEGKAQVALHFGSFGSIKGDWIKINSNTPTELWLLAYLTIGALLFAAFMFVYKLSKLEG